MRIRWLAPALIVNALGPALVACSCAENTALCQGYWAVSTVFSGTVTQITAAQRPVKGRDAARRESIARFSVLKSYKGDSAAEIQVATGMGGGDCGFSFQLGESYLVYADTDPEANELNTSFCTLTKPLAAAKQDLDYIAALQTEPKGTRLYGRVYDRNRKEKNGLTFAGLAGAYITLYGPKTTRQVSSDQDGNYEIKGLAAGSYRIEVALPNYQSSLPSDLRFDLNGQGCTALYLPLVVNGHIAGRVTGDKGNSIAHQRVELADPNGNGLGELQAETDGSGHYQFSGVRPGDFLLGVNLSDPTNSTSPYVRTYFPNSPAKENAAIIHLSKDGDLNGLDIYLSTRTEARIVSGVVLWPDGKPAANATISLLYPDYPWRSDSQPGASADGKCSIQALTNLRTILWVQAPNSQGAWMSAGEIELPIAGEIKPQTLYLDHAPAVR